MQIQRAQELASSYQLELAHTENQCLELRTLEGKYIDTLYSAQIGEIEEEDFIEFYLKDEGIDPNYDPYYDAVLLGML